MSMHRRKHCIRRLFTMAGIGKLRYKKFVILALFFVLVMLCFKDSILTSMTRYVVPTGLECYKVRQETSDVLDVGDYAVEANSMFFLETSCRHSSGIDITKRQACAYESAAKVHPTSEVLVLFPSPISLKNQSQLVKELLTYPNIKFLHIDMERYFSNTPLENFYKTNSIEKSYWPKSHASDALRFLTLWKYGGTYLDSDIVIIRPINTMENFAGAESKKDIAAGFLNLNISGNGRAIADQMVSEIANNFRGWDWGYNGPGVVSRVLRRICNENSVIKMTPEKCQGFTVFPPSAFYPVSWQNWRMYFNENASETFLAKLEESFGIHVWNKHSSKTPVKIGSKMPYSVFASRYCPKIYSIVGKYL